ncbi:lymphocyte antigen 75 [Anabrus simplex]|uniref:lymphocyte antigen 75 n=1 Tax=Anabrus simplex TaxID=316456 RepID=UPI0034DD0B03
MYRILAALAVVTLSVNGLSIFDTRSGYTLYPRIGFYKYHQELLNWSDAYRVCLQEGGHLAIANSQEEAELLLKIFTDSPRTERYFFLGFHDLYLRNNFTTIYGEPVQRTGFFNWAHTNCVGQNVCATNVTDNKRLSCGVMGLYSVEAGFYVHPCDNQLHFICEKELWYDYERISNMGYYKLHKIGKTWGDAWKTCRDEGADLAVIQSSTEMSTLQEILGRYPEILDADSDNKVHLGFHNKLNPNIYSTVYGTFLNSTGYIYWATNEPSASGNCGGLVRKGQLFMGNCDAKLAFFCKHPIVKK